MLLPLLLKYVITTAISIVFANSTTICPSTLFHAIPTHHKLTTSVPFINMSIEVTTSILSSLDMPSTIMQLKC
ncbi:hypothetical protein EXN66_Car007611 [Channa argus]|uniref:Secreted protein n=1 Tax=Channa argus TaxID=215402 RepID=A0A6G1PPL1_CHAAH|nr:hypothetical protein EXN66_Car007611 [Channa argus]